jgi:hypothetical protein
VPPKPLASASVLINCFPYHDSTSLSFRFNCSNLQLYFERICRALTMLTSASKTMIVTMVVFMVVSGLSVVLRLYLRRQKRTALMADDYFVVAAWVSLVVCSPHIA